MKYVLYNVRTFVVGYPTLLLANDRHLEHQTRKGFTLRFVIIIENVVRHQLDELTNVSPFRLPSPAPVATTFGLECYVYNLQDSTQLFIHELKQVLHSNLS